MFEKESCFLLFSSIPSRAPPALSNQSILLLSPQSYIQASHMVWEEIKNLGKKFRKAPSDLSPKIIIDP